MQDYQKLAVWQKARTLVKEVYILTKAFPKSEIYGLNKSNEESVNINPSQPCRRLQ